MDLVINGRFLGRPPTGVDRTAFELTRALAYLEGDEAVRLSVAVPPGAAELSSAVLDGVAQIDVVGRDLPGHLWEQFHLARVRPDAWLIGFCNTGPIVRRRQAVLFHDAQFRSQPDSYSRAFRITYSMLLPVLSRRAALAYTVSAYSRRTLEREQVVPVGKLELLANGTDHLDRVSPDPEVLGRNDLAPGSYFLAVGSLAPHKNLRTLYDAVTSASGPRAPLVVVGSADPRVLRASGGTDSPQIKAVGRVSDPELKALYAGALALCLPSLTEGFGLTAVEAMRCGTPVVAADAGALPEVCGDAALLIPPTDSDAWRRTLADLEVNAEQRALLRSRGLERARMFEWRTSARVLVSSLRRSEQVLVGPDLAVQPGGQFDGIGS